VPFIRISLSPGSITLKKSFHVGPPEAASKFVWPQPKFHANPLRSHERMVASSFLLCIYFMNNVSFFDVSNVINGIETVLFFIKTHEYCVFQKARIHNSS